mmetsp:Transcript_23509/g.62996  ORF Transcript_23509/g.62996 Transcript_23509/m.62996 type:complete len:218 (-) Transcript_23509:451-1104(-)
MAHAELVDKRERSEHLVGELRESRHREVSGDAVGRIGREQVAIKVEERVTQQLGDDEEVLLEVEVVEHLEDRLRPQRVVLRQQRQDPDLANALIEAILFVAQHLDRHHYSVLQVKRLDDAREGALADDGDNPVALDNDGADLEGEVGVVLEAVDVRVVQHGQRDVRQLARLVRRHRRRVVEDDAAHVVAAAALAVRVLIILPRLLSQLIQLGPPPLL